MYDSSSDFNIEFTSPHLVNSAREIPFRQEHEVPESVKYESVEAFFHAEHPHLVYCLSKTTGHWPSFRDNSLSPKILLLIITSTKGTYYQYVYEAALALAEARLSGKLPISGIW